MPFGSSCIGFLYAGLRVNSVLLEVDLQEALQVQVRDIRLIRHAQELRERRVGEDTALELRIEAVVALDVVRDELRHLRLGALGTRRDTHERRQLIADRALAQEGVVRTALLPRGAGLRGQRRRVHLHLALALARLTLDRLRRRGDLVERRTDTRRQLTLEALELVRERRQNRLRRARIRRRNGGRHGRRRRHRRDNHLRLGHRGLALLLGSWGRGCHRGYRRLRLLRIRRLLRRHV